MDRLRKGRLINPDGCSVALTFGEFTEGFFDEGSDYLAFQAMRGRELRGNTLKAYSRSLDALREEFSKARLEAISPDMVQRFLFRKKADGLSASSCNMFLTVMSVVMDHAYARCAIDDNPCARVKRIASSGARREAFTADEVAKLFSDPRLWGNRVLPRLVCEVMACTGMRVGEAVSLRMEDLEEGGWLRVRRNVTTHGFKPPKNGRERLVPLPDGLRERITRHAEGGWLFPSPTSRYGVLTEGSITSALSLACRNAGVRQLTPHSLRHFFNSQISVASVNPSAARSILGHGSPAMTDHYFHLGASDSSSVREIQGRILGSMA